MKIILVLLSVLFSQSISIAQIKPADSVSLRYAVNDTAARSDSRLHYSLVKFNVNPGNQVQQYGVIKILSPVHFILRNTDFTATLKHNVLYNYPANNNWKATDLLLQQVAATRSTDSITLQAGITASAVSFCRIKKQTGNIIVLTVQQQDWNNFISQSSILFADKFRKAYSEILINTADPGANAVNTAQKLFPAIRGAHVTVSLKEDLLDTTDIDFAGRYISSSAAATVISTHATIMATTIGGAGNNGQKSLGAAPQVKFVSADFNTTLLPEDNTYFSQYSINLQNHSYGTGIENYYGLEAAAYDEQVYKTDTILHVFSSGNVGTEASANGAYQGIKGYANLSGSFKQAKNVLIAGGSNDSLRVAALSSKGPAFDGRVKPEIIAFGIDGTSGAAAITSGVAALLEDAYKQQYGKAPSAALVKALLVNSATKIDKVPLSYSSGYGSLHAVAALKTLQTKQFISGNNTQNFKITVPAGMQQLRVTLCWNDPAAALNTTKALVNDLDLTVTDVSGNSYQPWILSSAADSLTVPARRGVDHLNNIEQVTIDNPATGDFQIRVNDPVNGQQFYVVYDWIPEHSFQWLNPAREDILLAAGTLPVPIRWQSNLTGNGDLFYSLDSGTTWQQLAGRLSASQGLYYWSVPDTFSAALLKFVTADTSFTSDTFYISPRLSLQTGYHCGDSAYLFWSSQYSSTAYEVFQLGEQYMTPYTQTTDTFLTLINSASPYFAVSPVHKDGWAGLRSYGTNYQLQGTGCYVRTLLADVVTGNQVLLSLTLGTDYKLKTISWERASASGYVTLSTVNVNGTTYNYVDNEAADGLVYYRVKLVTDEGKIIYSDPVSAYVLNDHSYILFPNPVNTTLHILSKPSADLQLQIYDMSGRLLLRKKITGLPEDVWVGDLPVGIYNCVLFDNGKKVMAKKVVKQ